MSNLLVAEFVSILMKYSLVISICIFDRTDPFRSASVVGGHSGTYKSTGTLQFTSYYNAIRMMVITYDII